MILMASGFLGCRCDLSRHIIDFIRMKRENKEVIFSAVGKFVNRCLSPMSFVVFIPFCSLFMEANCLAVRKFGLTLFGYTN